MKKHYPKKSFFNFSILLFALILTVAIIAGTKYFTPQSTEAADDSWNPNQTYESLITRAKQVLANREVVRQRLKEIDEEDREASQTLLKAGITAVLNSWGHPIDPSKIPDNYLVDWNSNLGLKLKQMGINPTGRGRVFATRSSAIQNPGSSFGDQFFAGRSAQNVTVGSQSNWFWQIFRNTPQAPYARELTKGEARDVLVKVVGDPYIDTSASTIKSYPGNPGPDVTRYITPALQKLNFPLQYQSNLIVPEFDDLIKWKASALVTDLARSGSAASNIRPGWIEYFPETKNFEMHSGTLRDEKGLIHSTALWINLEIIKSGKLSQAMEVAPTFAFFDIINDINSDNSQ